MSRKLKPNFAPRAGFDFVAASRDREDDSRPRAQATSYPLRCRNARVRRPRPGSAGSPATTPPRGRSTEAYGANLIVKPLLSPFILSTRKFLGGADKLDGKLLDAVILMNASIQNEEPIARLALALAAVEMLAQSKKKWSDPKLAAIKRLGSAVKELEGLTDEEREEVQNAADGMRNFGVNESCRRLIKSLNLDSHLEDWRRLYKARSHIFHGVSFATSAEINAAAELAVPLCARIILAAVAEVLPTANAGLDATFPMPAAATP